MTTSRRWSDQSYVSDLQLVERKALLEPLVAGKPGLQFNGLETGDGELILKHAGKLGFEGVVSKTIDAPYAPGNRGLLLAIEMQEIEGIVDDSHLAFAVGRRLGMGEARQSGVVNATEFAVDVGSFHVQVPKRRAGAWIFVGPVEASPG